MSNSTYEIVIGFSPRLVLQASKQWNDAKSAILANLLSQEMPNDEAGLRVLFEGAGLSDWHWDWTWKSLTCRGDDFIWLYLVTEHERVQAIAIIYHPKMSRLDDEPIFYIDYVATAYWNRNPKSGTVEFKGAARRLIAEATLHANKSIGYRAGFSLHSLPTAESYYEKLGLTKFEKDPSKEDLVYFEADESAATALLQEAQ